MKEKQIFKVGDAVTWRDLKGDYSGVILASIDNVPFSGRYWLVSTPDGYNLCLTEACLHHV